jgi:hypothetical protein
VTRPADAPVSGLAPQGDGQVWHTLNAGQVLQAEPPRSFQPGRKQGPA